MTREDYEKSLKVGDEVVIREWDDMALKGIQGE